MLTLAFAHGAAPASAPCWDVGGWVDDCGSGLAGAFSYKHSHWIDFPGVGKFAFSSGSTQVRVWPDPASARGAVYDTFSRMLQPIILQALGGRQALHAGAAVGPSGVVAFCGPRGAGKS